MEEFTGNYKFKYLNFYVKTKNQTSARLLIKYLESLKIKQILKKLTRLINTKYANGIPIKILQKANFEKYDELAKSKMPKLKEFTKLTNISLSKDLSKEALQKISNACPEIEDKKSNLPNPEEKTFFFAFIITKFKSFFAKIFKPSLKQKDEPKMEGDINIDLKQDQKQPILSIANFAHNKQKASYF